VKPGSIAGLTRASVAVIDDQGWSSQGELGEIAVKKDHDPVFFLEYWKNAQATREKFIGDWPSRRPGKNGRGRLPLYQAAPTTSSRAPATASAGEIESCW